MGHAQYGEINRIGQKISFALFPFEVQIFQVLRNFSCSETNQTSFLSPLTFHGNQKICDKMAAPQLDQASEKVDISIILKTRIIGLQMSFHLRQFFTGTIRKWRLIFRHKFSLKKNTVSDGRLGIGATGNQA